MALPFMKLNNQSMSAGVMHKMRKPDEKPIDEESLSAEQDESGDDEMAQKAIQACAQDLLQAVQAQNVKGIAEAIQSAFVILDSMPHQEYNEESDNSFKNQNVKAAMQQGE